MTLDLSRSRVPPEGVPPWPNAHFSHQPAGIEAIVRWDDPARGRVAGGCFALFDETGAGKTKQVIDAAQVLFTLGKIRRVVVLAPGDLRSTYVEPELGELAKHLWLDLPCTVTEYHSRTKTWLWATEGRNDPRLDWYVTNYEFLASPDRLKELLPLVGRDTLLVCDESWMVKNWQAARTRAVRALRRRAGRVVLMNGTPIADKPLDIFAQANLMDPSILGITSMTKFKAAFAVMGGFMVQTRWGKVPTQVLRWQNLDVLQQRMAPYVLRRLKADCVDLPPKLEPVVLTATLEPSTWAHYKAMRDDMVSWLTSSTVSSAQQTIVKVMRLAQITSGFLGGVEALEELDDDREWGMEDDGSRSGVAARTDGTDDRAAQENPGGTGEHQQPNPDGGFDEHSRLGSTAIVEIGREKLDVFLGWLALKLEEDPALKLLVWTRFRPELARLTRELRERYPAMDVGEIRGGMRKKDKADAVRLMDPRTAPKGPATVVGTSAMSKGWTLTASHTVFRMSRSESLLDWLQGDDRVHRPTQTSPISYYDLVAVGPKGQKTADHKILAALLGKFDVAQWTTGAWVQKLTEE